MDYTCPALPAGEWFLQNLLATYLSVEYDPFTSTHFFEFNMNKTIRLPFTYIYFSSLYIHTTNEWYLKGSFMYDCRNECDK